MNIELHKMSERIAHLEEQLRSLKRFASADILHSLAVEVENMRYLDNVTYAQSDALADLSDALAARSRELRLEACPTDLLEKYRDALKKAESK